MNLCLVLVRSLFGANGNGFTDWFLELDLQGSMYLLAASALACTPLCKYLGTRIREFAWRHGTLGKAWDVVCYSVLPVILLLLATASLVGDSYNPFIYFQF